MTKIPYPDLHLAILLVGSSETIFEKSNFQTNSSSQAIPEKDHFPIAKTEQIDTMLLR